MRISAALLCSLAAFAAGCGHPRPTSAQSAVGARQFLEAIRYENDILDPRMAGLLQASATRRAEPRRAAAAITNRMIHREGTQLVDGKGESVRLSGVNLGGAFLWEAWEWGGDLALLRLSHNSESSIHQGLFELLGAERARAFTDEVHDHFISAGDLWAIARLGFNVVRVPFNHRMLEGDAPDTYREAGFAILDRLIDQAEASHVQVVLDLHGAPGGQSKYFIADPGPTLLWESPEHERRTVALWKTIARRYSGRTAVAGYDLLNEPLPPRGEDLVALYRAIIAGIREVDPDHLIILEGGDFARDFSMFSGPLDENQAYSFHMYTWFGEDPRRLVDGHLAAARRDGLPLWCGEFGQNTYASIGATLDVFDRPGNEIAGWAFWTWKQARSPRYPVLLRIPTSPAWDAVIQWISAP